MRIAAVDLLSRLIVIAEKAALISRLCRRADYAATTTNGDNGDVDQETTTTNNNNNNSAETTTLFDLLIQEKSEADHKNPRFIHDFKTFADVLIQEVAKYWLENRFVGLSPRVYGEETNHFENKLGESITVRIERDAQSTKRMLTRILDGNEKLSDDLLRVIYDDCGKILNCSPPIDVDESLNLELDDIAIWIDPIDSTSEYINGQWYSGDNPITPYGLQCVTCLFGVFHIKTGLPLMGVLHQPFHARRPQSSPDHNNDDNHNGRFTGRCIWGFNIDGICRNNLSYHHDEDDTSKQVTPEQTKSILVGGKESDEILNKLRRNGGSTLYVAGAGYKLLCVIVAQSDLLVTSSRTTYYWDTCAAHAILRSLGGGIVPLDDVMQCDDDDDDDDDDDRKLSLDLEKLQIRYRCKDTASQVSPSTNNNGNNISAITYNHSKGLVAYRSAEVVAKAIQILRS